MQLYPQARILAASVDDLASAKRRLLVARIATGDWDAVIVSRSAFERIPLSIPAQQRYLDAQLDDMRRHLDNSKGERGLTVKRLEAALIRAEERLKKLTDGAKDPGISFEDRHRLRLRRLHLSPPRRTIVDGVPTDFTVQTWNGSAWVTSAQVSGNSALSRWIPFSAPLRTSQVRLVVTASQTQNGNFTRVAELAP